MLYPRVHSELHGQRTEHVPNGGLSQGGWGVLPEVVRCLRSLPPGLLRLPAVLHWEAQLSVHQLLQPTPVQQAPTKETPIPFACSVPEP